MEQPIGDTGRYILTVKDSKPKGERWAGVDTRKEAMDCLKATAKGEDVLNIIPRTVPEPNGADALTRPETPDEVLQAQETAEGTPSGQSDASRAREEKLPAVLRFHRAMEALWDPDEWANHLKQGQHAMAYSLCQACGEGFERPDWKVRKDYDRIYGEYFVGKPRERDTVREPERITMADLKAKAIRSPAVRRALRRLLQEAEVEAAKLGAAS